MDVYNETFSVFAGTGLDLSIDALVAATSVM